MKLSQDGLELLKSVGGIVQLVWRRQPRSADEHDEESSCLDELNYLRFLPIPRDL